MARNRRTPTNFTRDEVDAMAVGPDPQFRVIPIPQHEYDPDNTGHLMYRSSFDSRFNFPYRVKLVGFEGVWERMKTYRAFAIGTPPVRIRVGDMVEVKGNEAPVRVINSRKRKRDNNPSTPKKGSKDDLDTMTDYERWVAEVVECRAADEHNVFLTVAWMYRHEDLALEKLKQSYHGVHELVPSNCVDVVAAISVDKPANLHHWDEGNDPGFNLSYWDQNSLRKNFIYRQLLDVDATKPADKILPEPRKHCIDNRPFNPDTNLIHCPNCDRWLHERCITSAVMNDVREHGRPEYAKDSIFDPTSPSATSPQAHSSTPDIKSESSDSNRDDTQRGEGLMSRVWNSINPSTPSRTANGHTDAMPKTTRNSANIGVKLENPPITNRMSDTVSQQSTQDFSIDPVLNDGAPDHSTTTPSGDGIKRTSRSSVGETSNTPNTRSSAQTQSNSNTRITARLVLSAGEATKTPRYIVTVVRRKPGAKGTGEKWEQPVKCLFEDCKTLIPTT